MSNAERTILVFGATGRQGGSVANALLEKGWSVRALVRDPAAPTSMALGHAGVDLMQGSFTNAEAIRAAMRDAYGVFSVLPGDMPDGEEVRIGCAIADFAVESGIAHLVYSSGASVGETLTGVARFDAKPRIEAHIRDLPILATIIRPMIFMEMLTAPRFGLNQGRFTFLLKPEQSMQLIAVSDIGRFVAAIFADKPGFGGKTLKIASDTVTGGGLGAMLTEAAKRLIVYDRFPEEVLAANPDLAQMAESLEDGPLAQHVDLDVMREMNPQIVSCRTWLAGAGRSALLAALNTDPGQGESGA